MPVVLDEVHVTIGGNEILRGLTAWIAPGEMVALMGPSGSGKSTTLHVLAGLVRPTSGTVACASTDGTRAAWVQQTVNLLPARTAVDNVAIALAVQDTSWPDAKAAALAALDQVGLSSVAMQRARTLSGGETQRVAVARALVCKPWLVLADEPTGQLDYASSMLVVDAIGRMRTSTSTVVIATHDPNVAERCDRVVMLRNGRADS